MSDRAARVAAYEAKLREDATSCCLCSRKATHVLSWTKGCCTAHGLAYCDECSWAPSTGNHGGVYVVRDDLTPELVEARVAYRRERYPMPYRSTVSEVA